MVFRVPAPFSHLLGSSVRPGAPAAAEPCAVAAAEGQSGAVLHLAQG